MRQKRGVVATAPGTIKKRRNGCQIAPYLCGIGIGGTFTDCVIVDDEVALWLFHYPSCGSYLDNEIPIAYGSVMRDIQLTL